MEGKEKQVLLFPSEIPQRLHDQATASLREEKSTPEVQIPNASFFG